MNIKDLIKKGAVNSRKEIEDKITANLADAWEVCTHLYQTCIRLEVYPDGEILFTEEPTDNTWHTIDGKPVEELARHYNSCPCNCDWCAEWSDMTDQQKENEGTKEDFLMHCVENNENPWRDLMIDALYKIPYGYFHFENKESKKG